MCSSDLNDILDLSKLEAGQFELHEEDVDIATVIHASTHLIDAQAKKSKVRVTEAVARGLPALRADERRIRQILINLLSNAVKFTQEGGYVRVAAAITDEGLVVTVSDNGIGMSPEQIPKALEPFGQIDSKISRRYEGTGLGLPLTKHLVELHGGKLTIESQLNAGTTVKVMLPRERLVQRPARTAATA